MFDVQSIRSSDRADYNMSTAAGLTPETSVRILYQVVRGTIQPINPINLINYSTN